MTNLFASSLVLSFLSWRKRYGVNRRVKCFLCLSATDGISDQEKVIEDLGMLNRNYVVIDSNPIRDYWLVAKLKRPSNQTAFKDDGGLEEMLLNLYVEEFVADPTKC